MVELEGFVCFWLIWRGCFGLVIPYDTVCAYSPDLDFGEFPGSDLVLEDLEELIWFLGFEEV